MTNSITASNAPRTAFIEESRTPIYRRIAHAIGAELVRRGMHVLVVKPDALNTTTFQQLLAQQNEDTVFVSNASSQAIQSKLPAKDEYFFESFKGKLVFVHQDAVLGGLKVLDGINKLQAWKRVANRSVHLCIEKDNVADLGLVGIKASVVPHASEVPPAEPITDGFSHVSSFVGHVVPSIYCPQTIDSVRLQESINEMVTARRINFSTALEPLIKGYIDQTIEGLGHTTDRPTLRLALAQWLRNEITGHTMPFRGWVFEECDISSLDIFGGDPAYLHKVERNLKIEKTGVKYHSAVYDPITVGRIFNQSRVSINISSLQFDHAVVNRFHDVIMSGGLCLTDARDGLPELTSAHAELSFKTVSELRDKVEYYSRPEKSRERSLLIKSVQADVRRNSGYEILADAIFQAISEL